MNKIK
jgi:hypothetical protein